MNKDELSDEKIVEIVREKDKEMYKIIIERYRTKLSHYLKKFIYDPDELEDVLQMVFIKTYQNLYGFNVHKKFSSWIYRISHNEAINHLRKNNHVQIALTDVEYKIVDEKVDLNGGVDNMILRKTIQAGLSKLKNKYRDPLVLFYFEEKSYEEISDILHIPKSTVGTLVSRGKKQLREMMSK